jgi:hypothetical protein
MECYSVPAWLAPLGVNFTAGADIAVEGQGIFSLANAVEDGTPTKLCKTQGAAEARAAQLANPATRQQILVIESPSERHDRALGFG